MKSARNSLIALIIAVTFTACPSGDKANSSSNASNRAANAANSGNSTSVKDDVDELEMIIKLPFHPEEAVWREEVLGKTGDNRVPAPTDKKLVAVLRFSKENSDKIAAQAQTFKPVLNETINTESWFPAELIAQSQTSGDETIKGKTYAANEFLNPPYSEGKITRIEGTEYFVLELFAK